MNGSRRPVSKLERNLIGAPGPNRRWADWVGLACALVWLAAFAGTIPCEAQAQAASESGPALTIEETESLVRARYYEGLPEDQIARIDEAGAERIAEMLGDPAESGAHANILLVLGMCGGHGVLEAIEDWAANLPDGELDRHAFRAWQALPYALGHLAKHDPRAVARLDAKLSEASPRWTFRQHRGAKLHRLQRRAAATALGQTGLPEADRALDRASRQGSDPAFREHLRAARSELRDRSNRRSNREENR